MTVQPLPGAGADLRRAAVFCPLTDVGSLRFDGPDAGTFLQAQLSSDVRALAAGALQRSTYVSPKGRVLADLVLWRSAGADVPVGALLAADLAAPIAKRLSLFVLRARVKVHDATPDRVRVGVTGTSPARAVQAALGRAPAPGEALEHQGIVLLGLADGRVVLEADAARDADIRQALAAHAAAVGPAAWQLAQVRAGVPLVSAATSDQFVPQALNLDALDAVSFRKGCYPGQEIVARMQYLGRLKERLFGFRVQGPPPAAGARVYAPVFGDQPCGTVIGGAPADDVTSELLAVVQRAAVEAGTLRLGSPDGAPLTPMALPYAVPEPAEPRGRLA